MFSAAVVPVPGRRGRTRRQEFLGETKMSIQVQITDSPTAKLVLLSRHDGGTLKLWFSYNSVIGFQDGNQPRVVSENCWSTTTGKHLNAISDKKSRVPRGEFIALLAAALREYVK
jgi:hypothetical protein